MEQILNLIDGQLCASTSGRFLDNVEPATGRVYSQLTQSNAEDVRAAVAAAERAAPSWGLTSPQQRARFLRAMAAKILERKGEFARAESKDSGKTIKQAETVDIPRAAMNLEFFADTSMEFGGESYTMRTPANTQAVSNVLREPLGVVAAISPWNLPLYLFTWKIAPALAAGNTVVAKPSEVTPMTAWMLAKIAVEVGLPKGVLNVVHGLGAEVGAVLCEHPSVKAITFTGSTQTGRSIAQSAAKSFKKVALEMGGKNPFLIFKDADLEKGVDLAVRAGFSNQGQICLCGSRVLIESSIYEAFKAKFLQKVKALKVGDPNDPASDLGAVVSKQHFDKIIRCLDIAREEGGAFLTGGQSQRVAGRCEQGWFINPTVIEGLGPKCRTNQEEIFGPVVTLQSFDSEAQALELANDSRYGLASTIITEDFDQATRVSTKLQTGIVWINTWMLRDLRTPFGGQKESGLGKEGGLEAMRFFTDPKSVTMEIS